MNWFQKLRLRVRALFQKGKLDARMDDEMRSHIEMQTQENIEAGMKPEEARYAALRHFGWVESEWRVSDNKRKARPLVRSTKLSILPTVTASEPDVRETAGRTLDGFQSKTTAMNHCVDK